MTDDGLSADDRLDVADVLVRYASGIDGRDWQLLRSCFSDDVEADYGVIGVWHGADEITTWMRETHEPCGHTLHRISNVAVSGGGDAATARSYVDALVLFADDTSGTRATGWYDDELVRAADGWRIARRRFTPVLLQLVPDGTVLDLAALLATDEGA